MCVCVCVCVGVCVCVCVCVCNVCVWCVCVCVGSVGVEVWFAASGYTIQLSWLVSVFGLLIFVYLPNFKTPSLL